MEKVKHNLDYEKGLLDLFNYSLVSTKDPNMWLIFDENNKNVGYIKYDTSSYIISTINFGKLEYNYHTFIDSDIISCEMDRNPYHVKNSYESFGLNTYEFDIKRENGEKDSVQLILNSEITLYSDKYGFWEFHVSEYDGLYLNYHDVTENYKIEEVLLFYNSEDEYKRNKEYTYQIKYCDKKDDIYDDKKILSRKMTLTEQVWPEDRNILFETGWYKGRTTFKTINVKETPEDAAIKNELGINCMNRFKYLVNQIIPIKKDIISLIVNEDTVEKAHVQMFFPEYVKKENNEQRLRNDNSEN